MRIISLKGGLPDRLLIRMNVLDFLKKIVAILSLMTLFGYLLIQLADPLPVNPWVDGTLAATINRYDQGGPYYESPSDGLCDATWPYGPGTLLLEDLVKKLTGWQMPFVSRFLGVVSLIAFTLLAILTSVSLRVRPVFAITGVTFASFVLSSRVVAYQTGFSFVPDIMLCNCAFALALLAPRLERGRIASKVLLVAILFVAALFKAQALGLYVGVLLFLCLRPIPNSRRIALLACLVAAGLAATVCILLIPNCWQSSVVAMYYHPRNLKQMVWAFFDAWWALWPMIVLPISMLVSSFLNRFRAQSLQELIVEIPAWSPQVTMLGNVFLFFFGLQAIAAMKYGGGAIDFEFAAMLGLPLLLLGNYWCIRKRKGLIWLLSVISIIGLFMGSKYGIHEIESKKRSLEENASYLAGHYPHGKVMYSTVDYRLVRKAGLLPVTDLITIWHFTLAKFNVANVIDAIRREVYDVVIFVDPADDPDYGPWDTPEFLAYKELLREHYIVSTDPNLPEGLRGRVLIPMSRGDRVIAPAPP